jgi:hypothetical protein
MNKVGLILVAAIFIIFIAIYWLFIANTMPAPVVNDTGMTKFNTKYGLLTCMNFTERPCGLKLICKDNRTYYCMTDVRVS